MEQKKIIKELEIIETWAEELRERSHKLKSLLLEDGVSTSAKRVVIGLTDAERGLVISKRKLRIAISK